MRNHRRRFGPALAALLLGTCAIAIAAYVMPYAYDGYPALLQSSPGISVARDARGISFVPIGQAKPVGLVFYCEAKVPPEAYAYLGQACAKAGFTAVLASFPLNLAIFKPSAIEGIAESLPGVSRWVLGGHSMGGAVACSYIAKRHADSLLSGLILLSAYPGGGTDLSGSSFPIVCVSATRDGLKTGAKLAKAAPLLPASTRYVEIAGGNHAQFGEYGPQPGDGAAEIPGEAQRAAVVEEALALLGRA